MIQPHHLIKAVPTGIKPWVKNAEENACSPADRKAVRLVWHLLSEAVVCSCLMLSKLMSFAFIDLEKGTWLLEEPEESYKYYFGGYPRHLQQLYTSLELTQLLWCNLFL